MWHFWRLFFFLCLFFSFPFLCTGYFNWYELTAVAWLTHSGLRFEARQLHQAGLREQEIREKRPAHARRDRDINTTTHFCSHTSLFESTALPLLSRRTQFWVPYFLFKAIRLSMLTLLQTDMTYNGSKSSNKLGTLSKKSGLLFQLGCTTSRNDIIHKPKERDTSHSLFLLAHVSPAKWNLNLGSAISLPTRSLISIWGGGREKRNGQSIHLAVGVAALRKWCAEFVWWRRGWVAFLLRRSTAGVLVGRGESWKMRGDWCGDLFCLRVWMRVLFGIGPWGLRIEDDWVLRFERCEGREINEILGEVSEWWIGWVGSIIACRVLRWSCALDAKVMFWFGDMICRGEDEWRVVSRSR